MDHAYADVNGVRLHYVTTGRGPLVLFLHGFPEFWYAWTAQLAEFGRDHRAVAPDMRGYNLSSKPTDLAAYRVKHLVTDVRALADHLGATTFALVGHDWGGVVAWAFALAHPDRLEQLVVVNAPPREPRRAVAVRRRPHDRVRARRVALGHPRAARTRQPPDPPVPGRPARAMIVGVPREIKPGEQRVALTPAGARALAEAGHRVEVEHGAGGGSGIRDDEYATVGAALVTADEVWQGAELVLKVKEPLPAESARLRPGQILLTYLHLAPAPELARALRDSGALAIAYETVQRADGSLPLLTPMSEVAGRLSVQEGAFYLGRAHGGRGILLSGVPGVPPGNVVILGA